MNNNLNHIVTNKGLQVGVGIGLIGGFLFSKIYLKKSNKESLYTAVTAAVFLALPGFIIGIKNAPRDEPKKKV